MQRYGFFLPKTKAFRTVEYLQGVLDGSIYCPKFDELKLRPCPKPPTKILILEEIDKIFGTSGKTIGSTDKALPETQFLLAVLSTLNASHRFFSRSYQPPPPKRRKEKVIPPLKFPHDFFKDQPELTGKQIKKASNKTTNKLRKLQNPQ